MVDASVAAKWVVAEEGHAESLSLANGQALIGPDFVLIETANILWKKVRLGELTPPQAREGLNFIRNAYDEFLSSAELLDSAFDIALHLDHPIYDCLYLACAEARGATVISCDKRLAGKVASDDRFKVDLLSTAGSET